MLHDIITSSVPLNVIKPKCKVIYFLNCERIILSINIHPKDLNKGQYLVVIITNFSFNRSSTFTEGYF